MATDRDTAWLETLRHDVYKDLFDATWGSWLEHKHLSQFKYQMDRCNINTIEIQDTAVGMIQLFDNSGPEDSGSIEVGEIQMVSAYQRRAKAGTILKDVVFNARGRHVDVILSVGLKNTEAMRLYRRLGIQEIRRSETHVHMNNFS